MTSFAFVAVMGFLLGMRHATDADHVIAVSTIVSRERGLFRASLIGAIWGVGHTVTIFAVGIGIILFRIAIPTRLGLAMEFFVGMMLIALGVLNLTGILQRLMSRADHFHDSSGGHLKEDQVLELNGSRTSPRMGVLAILRPLFVGIAHGLAGSAAIALFVMTTIPQPRWQLLYILIFGLGTIAGMALITTCTALPMAYAARHFSAWNSRLVYASGLLSVSFGLFVAYQTGVVGGLFSAHPHWTPQ